MGKSKVKQPLVEVETTVGTSIRKQKLAVERPPVSVVAKFTDISDGLDYIIRCTGDDVELALTADGETVVVPIDREAATALRDALTEVLEWNDVQS